MNRDRGGHKRGGGFRGRGGGGTQHAARGRTAQPTRQWVAHGEVGAGANQVDALSGIECSDIGKKNSEKASIDGLTKKFDDMSSSKYPSELISESHGSFNLRPNDGNVKGVQNLKNSSGVNLKAPLHDGISFDICEERNSSGVNLKAPLHVRNKARRNVELQAQEDRIKVFRPGMVLLKGCISLKDQVGAGANQVDALSGIECSDIGKKNSEKASIDGLTKKFDDMSSSKYPSELISESHGSFNLRPNDGNVKGVKNVPQPESKPLNETYIGPSGDSHIPSLPTNSELNESSAIIQSRYQNLENCSPSHFIYASPQTIGCQFSPEVPIGKTTFVGTSGKKELDSPSLEHDGFSFDICEERNSSGVKLKAPLHVRNKARRNEKLQAQEDRIKVFRPGMVLLKGYISLKDQVKLVKSCRDLGRGPGGFYQPGYRDGAKLHLKMMCLGKNWDPETSRYGDERPIDKAKPPPIPDEFQRFVVEAIKESHRHLESNLKLVNARKILPPMSPDICIINFYTKTGNLGLHQDKDETKASLDKRLPVVSFSLGDTAEFLFGDERDVDKADKLKLESGDVLIFGGESRHIFHGVSNILADTAPKALLDDTQLKPGRLNLTFREY